MRLEVYPTDADAMDAAAAVVAERVRASAASGRAAVALGGGRPGRALMVALAGRGDLPWDRVEWYLADERCGPPGDPLGHAKAARESLFGPRGVASARVHGADPAAGSAEAVASAYAAEVARHLGAGGVFDVVALAVGADGRLGALPPGATVGDAARDVVVAPGGDGVERVTVALAAVRRARHLVVTAVGPDVARVVASALRDGTGPAGCVPPSESVTWVVDRDAASVLLADARPFQE